MMMRLGVERGGSISRYIYSYHSETDRLTLDEKLDPALARISITFANERELRQSAPSILSHLSGVLGMKWVLLTGWKVSDRLLTPARARLKEKQLCNEGLVFSSVNGYRLGMSSSPCTDLAPFFLEELFKAKSYGICTTSPWLLDTKGLPLADLVRSSARSFAAPNSAAVLRTLDQTIGAIAYIIKDDSLRPGIVILTNSDGAIAQMTNSKVFSQGINFEVCETEDHVWAL